ncbi:hypothetical protein [Novosphingobium sp. ST904]|uniref:hypothetical protein n=1 Tax=Novosphingobium sp. ST904 TaxID=1684385 RepID=UPI0006C882DB|nr:hypothetical protein [Novosphingobium sp. ST904]KPH61814.1 hypothetical protein ADT71_16445 [Novosphingobium sp. ST904]TCM34365.1 hypothetical protein EDF59_11849 [Novosphingobium sp. ST904]
MAAAKDLMQLGTLVAARHGWPEAKAFKAYELADADRMKLAGTAVELLKVFPKTPGGNAAHLTAAFAVQLDRHLAAPVHVVAGTLAVDGKPVYGDRLPFDGPAVFGDDEPQWNGHLWVMVGPFIADIAIFRAANSSDCPPELARHVHSVFGQDKGLYVDHWRRSRQVGLSYEPQYVLSRDEVTQLMGGAYRLLQGS